MMYLKSSPWAQAATTLAAALCMQAATAAIPEDFELVEFMPTGSFTWPLAVRHANDGTGRLFVVQQDGQVRIIDDGAIVDTPFLDVSSLTSAGTFSEQGLLGLAFHPDHANNGRVYINHTASGVAGVTNGDTVIAEYQVEAGNGNVVDPASRRHVLVIPQDFANHNGGDIHFGPDGYLYIGMGDGGSGNDPCNRAQTLDPTTSPGSCQSGQAAWLLGKMLRIDVDNTTPAGSNNLCAAGGDGSAGYAVPSDNPFVGEADRCGEVWTYGLRNPFRFSFDRATGDLFIADVGQGRWEEVNFEPAGAGGGRNYGWRVCEASYLTGTTSPCNLAGSTLPVLEYTLHGAGHCAITGGYRYRGPVTSMQGIYLYADFCTRQLWLATESGGDWTAEAFGTVGSGSGYPDGLSSFGEDEAGNLYLTQRNGRIWVVAGDQGEDIFHDRFEQ